MKQPYKNSSNGTLQHLPVKPEDVVPDCIKVTSVLNPEHQHSGRSPDVREAERSTMLTDVHEPTYSPSLEAVPKRRYMDALASIPDVGKQGCSFKKSKRSSRKPNESFGFIKEEPNPESWVQNDFPDLLERNTTPRVTSSDTEHHRSDTEHHRSARATIAELPNTGRAIDSPDTSTVSEAGTQRLQKHQPKKSTSIFKFKYRAPEPCPLESSRISARIGAAVEDWFGPKDSSRAAGNGATFLNGSSSPLSSVIPSTEDGIEKDPAVPNTSSAAQKWSDNDLSVLVSMRSEESSWAEIAEALGRSARACQLKYTKQRSMLSLPQRKKTKSTKILRDRRPFFDQHPEKIDLLLDTYETRKKEFWSEVASDLGCTAKSAELKVVEMLKF